MRLMFHWWRRRDGFAIGERLQRFRALLKDEALRVEVKYAEPDERVRPRVSVRKRALQLARKVS